MSLINFIALCLCKIHFYHSYRIRFKSSSGASHKLATAVELVIDRGFFVYMRYSQEVHFDLEKSLQAFIDEVVKPSFFIGATFNDPWKKKDGEEMKACQIEAQFSDFWTRGSAPRLALSSNLGTKFKEAARLAVAQAYQSRPSLARPSSTPARVFVLTKLPKVIVTVEPREPPSANLVALFKKGRLNLPSFQLGEFDGALPYQGLWATALEILEHPFSKDYEVAWGTYVPGSNGTGLVLKRLDVDYHSGFSDSWLCAFAMAIPPNMISKLPSRPLADQRWTRQFEATGYLPFVWWIEPREERNLEAGGAVGLGGFGHSGANATLAAGMAMMLQ